MHLVTIFPDNRRPSFQMNLRQLRTLCEVVDSGLRVTDAAQATYRSQSSVTRQIQLLERELGFELFVRNRNKFLRITPQGEEILGIARRMLHDAENMLRIGKNLARDEEGDFTVATTHTQARYVLPPVIRQFVEKHPKVRLGLRQGSSHQCCELVALGKADLAICSDPTNVPDELVQIPCFSLYRSVITPPKHPLLGIKPLTLEALARYPLITYGEAFNGRWIVNKTFADRGLHPTIVLSAVDADVSKVYVGMGLGIAIFVSVAFDPKQDAGLRCIDARHLFKPSYLNLIARRHSYLRTFVFDFIHIFAPKIERVDIEDALFRTNASVTPRMQLPEL
jgi:LysR family cys regulon transcriptional activator